MPQTNKIDIMIYPSNDGIVEDFESPIEFEDVNYVSFVSSPGGSGEGTYGIPALLADDRTKNEGLPCKILYVNPHRITAMHATRKA